MLIELSASFGIVGKGRVAVGSLVSLLLRTLVMVLLGRKGAEYNEGGRKPEYLSKDADSGQKI